MTTYYIYKIYCLDDTILDFYIGSTKCLKQRKWYHKSGCNNENGKSYNSKIYQTIRENGGWDNWTMVCVEEIKDCSKIQATIREEEFRMELQANMNSRRCFTTLEQKKENARAHIKQKRLEDPEKYKILKKEYTEKNRETINARRRELRLEKIKEGGDEYIQKINQQQRLNYAKRREINK